MTEYNRAMHDLRRDAITEVADSMPNETSGQALVDAIIARLRNGLPALVEVEIEVLP